MARTARRTNLLKATVRVRTPSQRWLLLIVTEGGNQGRERARTTATVLCLIIDSKWTHALTVGRADHAFWCCAANSTGMVGYDFGAQSAFVSVGADTDVSGKEVQAR